MNNQFNNRIDNISIIQNLSYAVASIKVISNLFLNNSVGKQYLFNRLIYIYIKMTTIAMWYLVLMVMLLW